MPGSCDAAGGKGGGRSTCDQSWQGFGETTAYGKRRWTERYVILVIIFLKHPAENSGRYWPVFGRNIRFRQGFHAFRLAFLAPAGTLIVPAFSEKAEFSEKSSLGAL